MIRAFLLLIVGLLAGCSSTSSSSSSSASSASSSSKTSSVIGVYEEPVVAKPAPKSAGTAPGGAHTWHPDDLKEWYADYLKKETGDARGLLYQGSDAKFHYFIARIPSTKSWQSFVVAKSELKLAQEKKDMHLATPPRGYGFVDPFHGYITLPRVATP
jgi:hypothetical protein